MPLKFYISSFNLAKTHARPLTKSVSRNTYLFAFVFCFPVYKRLYRSSYLTLQSLVELLPILRGFSTKEGDIIRYFRVMKRNLERVMHVEQKLIEISLILHQEVRTSMTSYSLLVSFFQICPRLGSMNFRWLVSCLLDFKQNGSFLIKARYNWSNTVDFLISFYSRWSIKAHNERLLLWQSLYLLSKVYIFLLLLLKIWQI